MVGRQSQIDVLKGEQATHHETGAYKKHNRQRYLRNHQRRTEASVPESCLSSFPCVFQTVVEFTAYRVESRGQTAQQSRNDGYAYREEQDAQIEGDDGL